MATTTSVYGQIETDNEHEITLQNKELVKLIRSDTLKADSLGREIIVRAGELSLYEEEARANRYLGLMNILNGRLEKSRVFYERNLELALSSQDNLWQAKAFFALTEVTRRQGDDVLTLDYLLKALGILGESGDRSTLGKIYNGLGNYHREAGSYDKALGYYEKTIEVRRQLADSVGLFRSYQLVGNLYAAQELSTRAKQSFIQSLSYQNSNIRTRSKAAAYSNLGSIYVNENELDSAKYYYDLALIELALIDDKYSQVGLLNNLAALTYGNGNYKAANTLALQGVTLAIEIDAPKLLSSLYYNISDNYKALGNYKESFHYYKLSDSIDYEVTNTDKNAQLAEMQVKYKAAEKDKEIAQQNLDLTKADTQRNQLIAGVVLLLFVIVFVSWSLARKRRSNKALALQKSLVEKREKEKALLLRELHHRVKNNFQIVSSLLNLQYYDTEDKETAEAIKSGQARVEAMSMIHRELYQSDNITTIEMQDYVSHLIDNTAYSFNYDSGEFDIKLDISHAPLGVKYAIPLGVIINELITNSFKHAFKAVDRPLLGVLLEIDSTSKRVTLKLWDNGPGIPDSSEIKETSFGLELIQDLVSQLKGKLTTSQKVVLEFPYEPQEAYVES